MKCPLFRFGLVISCCILWPILGCTQKTELSVNPYEWQYLELAKLPLVAEIPIDSGERDKSWLIWSPDNARIAWTRREGDKDMLCILDLSTKAVTSIPIDGLVYSVSTQWHPGGRIMLVGVCDENAPRIPMTDLPSMAKKFVEYDVASASVVRELTHEFLGGYSSWAAYSAKGDQLVVSVCSEDDISPGMNSTQLRSALLRSISAARTVVVPGEGNPRVVASGRDALTMPIWANDDKGLIHSKIDFLSGWQEMVAEWRGSDDSYEIVQCTSSGYGSPSFEIDRKTDEFTDIHAYRDPTEMLFYEVAKDGDREEVLAWEIRSYSFATKARSTLVDLRSLFLQQMPDDRFIGAVEFLDACSTWCCVRIRPGVDDPWSYWLVALDGRKQLVKFYTDVPDEWSAAVSPDARLLAVFGGDSAVRVYDIASALAQSESNAKL